MNSSTFALQSLSPLGHFSQCTYLPSYIWTLSSSHLVTSLELCSSLSHVTTQISRAFSWPHVSSSYHSLSAFNSETCGKSCLYSPSSSCHLLCPSRFDTRVFTSIFPLKQSLPWTSPCPPPPTKCSDSVWTWCYMGTVGLCCDPPPPQIGWTLPRKV